MNGGEGGIVYRTSNLSIGLFACSSGGIAGKGGEITVSGNCKVYAYNGDFITNEDYDNQEVLLKVKEITESNVEVIDRNIEGTVEKFAPCPIFAQNGVLREVRYSNIGWTSLEDRGVKFFEERLGEQLSEEAKSMTDGTGPENVQNFILRKAMETEKSGYINAIDNSFYGIGSGAGYIEVSNGTYKIDPSLN